MADPPPPLQRHPPQTTAPLTSWKMIPIPSALVYKTQRYQRASAACHVACLSQNLCWAQFHNTLSVWAVGSCPQHVQNPFPASVRIAVSHCILFVLTGVLVRVLGSMLPRRCCRGNILLPLQQRGPITAEQHQPIRADLYCRQEGTHPIIFCSGVTGLKTPLTSAAPTKMRAAESLGIGRPPQVALFCKSSWKSILEQRSAMLIV